MKNKRYFFFYGLLIVCSLLIFIRLCDLQIVNGAEYKTASLQRLYKTVPIQAPRGEIYDRYGRPLVTNRMGFSIQVQKQRNMKDEDLNRLLCNLIDLINKGENGVTDDLPITGEKPYAFLFSDDTGEAEKKWKTEMELPNGSPEEIIAHYKTVFRISDEYSEEQVRNLVGVRYDMLIRGFSTTTPFTLAKDVDLGIITTIKEQNENFPGVNVLTEPIREYAAGSPAAHILGRVGNIDAKEYETLKDQGYSYNDVLGKQGLEKYLEKYLRGTNGMSTVQQNSYGRNIDIVNNTDPVPGQNAYLTLDLDVQLAAEKALADTISNIRRTAVGGKGADVEGGAVVVEEINTGEILAIASYPSYDPANFNKDYQKLFENKLKPMFNRAIAGAYPPGSTFKMVTATAALEENIIGPKDTIYDEVVYRYYEGGYQPKCLGSHGDVDIEKALQVSCNYYFYDVGRRLTIENIDKYALKYGLAQKTGIELSDEEAGGKLAGPEDRKKNGLVWYPGDTLQAAIGQSDFLFTPVQMASYISMLANNGVRYRPHLVKSIRSYNDRELIDEVEPEIVAKEEFKQSTMDAIHSGMRKVALEGSGASYFASYDIPVACKTGTSEMGKGSDNANFVAYAPYDDPQIAISIVIEHAGSGSACGPVAQAVIDAYMKSQNQADTIKNKNELQ